jgi:hypothetical protein
VLSETPQFYTLLLLCCAADRSSVPGQAFHDWRNALIAAKYSSSRPPSSISAGSNKKGAAEYPQTGEWVNIVGSREVISELQGPAAPTTTHPTAKQRLALARALIAAAKAEALAGAAATAAVGVLAGVGKPTGSGAQHADAADAAESSKHHGEDEGQMPGHRGNVFNERKLAQQQTRTIRTAVDSLPSSTGEYELLLQQLTNLMIQQPYKPVRTDPDLVASTLMHFVHRGSQNRLYLLDKPW